MLAFPGFTRSIFDDLLNDELSVHPMEMIMPRQPYSCRGARQPRALAKKKQPEAEPSPVFGSPAIKDGKYGLALDMHQFAPEEVKVQMDGERMLKVTGRREVKSEDGSSYELREYSHHFALPEVVEAEKLSVKLDTSGQLQIQAPVKTAEAVDGLKSIPVEFVSKQ